ncbi:hypothetical protein FNH05_21305 [Amycolatopsis rhizosphaerae]|uniref:Uncharacterized protein n=1 Tax=Amycolatopsis rhizosphaerae TaxID=2053003 RepID=A0A558C7I0_9PSEU|nr:hypothetical protein [Amycolatopsis rhizosphaerae]TVT44562.1 hypothetical protein FNH05_21305 [Amycolatopsis rhizosphaerae]
MTSTETWDLTISTPIGKIKADIDLREQDGIWSGIARGSGEDVELRDLVRDGNRITWRQAITRPMRLNLVFEVTVDGDDLKGTSKAGRLPSSKVVGRRRL